MSKGYLPSLFIEPAHYDHEGKLPAIDFDDLDGMTKKKYQFFSETKHVGFFSSFCCTVTSIVIF